MKKEIEQLDAVTHLYQLEQDNFYLRDLVIFLIVFFSIIELIHFFR